MKNLYFCLAMLLTTVTANSQVLLYNFSASSGTFAPVNGGTSVATSTSVNDFLGDSKTSVSLPVGFSFVFNGVPYNNIIAASDGFISFNPSATTTLTNSLAATPATRRPLVAPLWDDLSGAIGLSSATYQTTGATGSRIFTMEWLNWKWNYAATGSTISFQVKLYEGSNKIDFVYRQESGAVNAGSASIGIAGVTAGTGNFWSLNNAGPSPDVSLSTETSTISAMPATGQVYTFTPAVACAGVSTGGLTTNNEVPTCANTTFILDVIGVNVALGQTYQWQSSPDGNVWMDIAGAILPYYSATNNKASASFRRRTSCGGDIVYSAPVVVTLSGPPENDDYCNAFVLTNGGTPDCNNTTCATSAGDPAFSNSTPNNTVWYKYTPLTSGAATLLLSRPGGLTTGLLGGWVAIYTATGTCPSLVFTEVPSMLFFDLAVNVSETLTTPVLTAGTTYYFMIDGFSGGFGAYCLQVVPTVAAPNCTTNISPATGTIIQTPAASLSWNVSPGATSYDLMISTNGNSYNLQSTTTGNTAPVAGLSASTTYYWYVVPKNAGGLANGCQSSAYTLITASPPPCVTTYISPASNAVGVPVNSNVVFEWSAVNGATSYDHYLGTTRPPATLYKNTTNTKDTAVFLNYNTKYYWSIVPKNNFSSAGCQVDSFTTAPSPTICTPLYTTGVRSGDSLVIFRLKGENGTQVANAPAVSSTTSYTDYYNVSNITLGAGTSYTGFGRTGATSNRITIWIDFNNDGFFENYERLLNNLDINSSNAGTYFSLYIPVGATAGEHRMRVRDVYNQLSPIDPCSSYQYGETEDYRVTIQSTFVVKNISPGVNNACFSLASTTIDTSSNNASQLVPLLDTAGNIVLSLNANGSNLGRIASAALFVNSGTVRTSGNGIRYLDRNYSVTPPVQPALPVTLRFYVTNANLLALQAVDPLVTGRASLNMSKTTQDCAAGGPPPSFSSWYAQVSNGSYNTDHYVDFSIPSFSSFYLHGGLSALPVTYVNLQGKKLGNVNQLTWKTVSEVDNKGFEIQRSADGVQFSELQFVPSAAADGNSSLPLDYTFTDKKPFAGAAYYRLKQLGKDGKSSFTNVVSINGTYVKKLLITTLFPNPATAILNVMVNAPATGTVNILITDAAGRVLLQKNLLVQAGNSQLPLNVAGLAPGSYFIRLSNDRGAAATSKFAK